MSYAHFASDIYSQRSASFFSAEENEETMQHLGVTQRVRQVGRGVFQADLIARSTEAGDLFSDRFSRGCSVYLEGPAGRLSLLFFRSAGAPLLASGCDVANNSLVVLPGSVGISLLTPDLAGSDSISLPADRFVRNCDVLCPGHPSIPLDEVTVIHGTRAELNALRNAIPRYLADAEHRPAGQEEHGSNLVASIIGWLGTSITKGHPESALVSRARKLVAQRARDYVEAHHYEVVRAEDLCRVTAVGIRTLQRCFREYFGLTLTDYLKTVRLDAAHRDLAVAEPAGHSVAAIALDHGFSHLGRFSVEYRKRFGESPRETLRRRKG